MAVAPDCQVGRSSRQVLRLCLQGETCHTFSSLTPWGGRPVRESTINSKVNFYNHFCAEWPTFPLVLGDFIILRKGSKRSTFYSATRYILRQSLCEKRGSQTSLQLPSNHYDTFSQVTFKNTRISVSLFNHEVQFFIHKRYIDTALPHSHLNKCIVSTKRQLAQGQANSSTIVSQSSPSSYLAWTIVALTHLSYRLPASHYSVHTNTRAI